MTKAIIFDFDGLIVDTESVWFEVYKETFQEYNVGLTIEKFSKVIGTSDESLWKYFEDETGVSIKEAKLEEKQLALYHQKARNLKLRDGVRSYLEEAEKLGLKIGLASSSSRDWVESYLKKFEIYDYFHVIKTKEIVKKVKPDPSLYIKVLEALSVTPEESIAFEDSLNGSMAAIAAGIRCVIVPNPVTEHLPFEHYHLLLSSMAEKSLSHILGDLHQNVV